MDDGTGTSSRDLKDQKGRKSITSPNLSLRNSKRERSTYSEPIVAAREKLFDTFGGEVHEGVVQVAFVFREADNRDVQIQQAS